MYSLISTRPATLRLLTSEITDFQITEEMTHINADYEKGLLTTPEFVSYYAKLFPWVSKAYLENAWNAIILDFPEKRLEFIESLAAKGTHRLFLLSNTNELHIEKVIANMGEERYTRFQNCFEKFYLSHQIHQRKPDSSCYQYVLTENNLRPEETLFIDDTFENTLAASELGIHVWNLTPELEDITTLFDQPYF